MDIREFLIRISVCMLLSIIIGVERQYRHGSVGLRTNALVGIGAFLFNYATFGFVDHDMSRIASGIVSGIGFLGAGMIIKNNSKIKGLNTAATLWCVAAIGILTSMGMVIEASVGTLLVVLSNVLLRLISLFIMEKVKKMYKERCSLEIVCDKDTEVIVRNSISKFVEKKQIRLIGMQKDIVDKNGVNLKVAFLTSRVEEVEVLVSNISAEVGVSSISWKHSKYYDVDIEDNSNEE
ncbi:MAG: MgtC/SapB family protein [Bacilli bacterium]|nr:MgtC/SapB family protein [Bacilli bacterium]